MTELSLPVVLTYLAFPLAAGHAFVRASTDNTSDVPLLAGPAVVYVDGLETVRGAALPWTPPGQKVVLNSGADHDVAVSTEEPSTSSKARSIGGNVGAHPALALSTPRDHWPLGRHPASFSFASFSSLALSVHEIFSRPPPPFISPAQVEGDVAKFRRFTVSRRVTVASKKAVALRVVVRDQIPVVESAGFNVESKVRVSVPSLVCSCLLDGDVVAWFTALRLRCCRRTAVVARAWCASQPLL